MAKKTNLQQPSIFTKDIPRMPEGYYSSGPNPNLEQFVEEHATPYDPETDDYKVPPFDKSITTTKATAIYNMHTYWSKKPHDAIQEYIKHYTQPGDLVLDPFCGSGGTALAALMEGRKAIAIDLSPAATFITKNYCTPINIVEFQKAYEKLEKEVKKEIDPLFETKCDRCDGKAIINFTIFSYVFECPRCLQQVPLFDCPEAHILKSDGKGTRKAAVCPFCQENGHLEEIKSGKAKRLNPIPVVVNYECLSGCEPANNERFHNDKNIKKFDYFQHFDLEKLREISENGEAYWYPTNRFPKNFSRWNSDLRTLNIERCDQLYYLRNLIALSILLKAIKENIFNQPLLLGFTAISLAMSRMQGYSKNAQFPNQLLRGTYYIPPVGKEYNPLSWYAGKIRNLIAGYSKIKIKSNDFIVSTDTATDLKLETNTIDYIFTDPPYSGTIQYGELNFVWEAWLGFQVDWYDKEIIVNSFREKTEEDWSLLMKMAMRECYRVLKPGRWVSLCYHDTSEGTWQLIQDIMAEVGFISEETEQTLYIDAGQKSYNQITAEKVTKRDLIINFRKPRPGETQAELIFTGIEDKLSFQEKAKKVMNESLESNPGSTADKIYDQLVSRMVRKGEFERHDFIALLRSVAEEVQIPDEMGKVISRWYLLETAETVDEAESKKEESAAKRLETFMTKYLKEHPEVDGVHYSDLFEQYLPVKDKPRRLLIDWLPEYFYRTSEGTWRPAQDDEERQQKSALRSSGSLRRIKRFINAILNSVPPSEKDRPENAATLANWIYQCRRAGLFEQGKLLYEQGGLSFENLSEEAQLAVEEDYKICIRRARQAVLEKDIKNQKNKSQASLF
jgi:DNA modification methylase